MQSGQFAHCLHTGHVGHFCLFEFGKFSRGMHLFDSSFKKQSVQETNMHNNTFFLFIIVYIENVFFLLYVYLFFIKV